jgi:UDP-N-acetylglucosamine enolpyruvyl transferase
MSWIEYIVNAFKKTGKKIGKTAAEAIPVAVQHHPYFVQQLSQKTWVMTDKIADDELVKKAIDELIHENSILYLREVENLSNTQVNFLRAICEKVEQLSSAETIKKYSLGTSANVLRIKSALEQKEVLDFMNPYAEFIDPIFELWLKRIYFK